MRYTFQALVSNSVVLGTGIALVSSLLATNSAEAFTLTFDPVNGVTQSTNTPATGVTATANFDFVGSGTSFDLNLTLTNTSPSPTITDSELVAFGFNLPSLVNAVTYKSNDTAFTRLFSSNNTLSLTETGTGTNGIVQSGATLSGLGGNNDFDLGIRVGAAGGNPNAGTFNGGSTANGLNPTETATVVFSLTLSESKTVAELEALFLAALTNDGNSDFDTGVRFQSIDGPGLNGASDKLFGGEEDDDDDDVSVPEPSTTLAGLAVVFGMVSARRRKQ
jgi:hypothetical protein